MADWKKAGRKLLFPPIWLIIALTAASAVLLAVVFVKELEASPVAYAAYALSFYSLCVICAACISVFPGYYRRIKQKIYSNKFGNRFMTDAAYKIHLFLYVQLGINLLYAAFNLFSGIWYSSLWSVTLAVYYIILAMMRFLLLRFSEKIGIGNDRVRELKRSRLCGVILMTLNLALSGVVALVISKNKGFEYNGITIYAMAAYTFYITVISIINIFKYRKYNSPLMSTAKSINLAAALVSMLSLETAMLSQFGNEDTAPYFNHVMIGASGAGVCAIVVTISLYTIIHRSIELKKIHINNSET